MLTIRQEQFDAFEHVTEAEFERRLMAYLVENHEDAVVRLPTGEFRVAELPAELLREIVRNGIARARSHDLTWESTVTAFVVIMFAVAPNFDEHPLIRRALKDARFEPNARLDEMWDSTTNENWETARASYDPAAWIPAGEAEGVDG
jgi:hypothetical protein